jgi:hypothetical protein
VDQGHGVLVIRPVGGVGVHHHVRIPRGEKPVEHLGCQAVALDEVAVQIEVAAIRPETKILRPDLVDTRRGLAVQTTIHVVDRDEQEHRVAQCGQPFGLGAEVPHQGHTGVYAFGLTGMDAVVVEENRALRLVDQFALKHTVCADQTGMHGDTGI